MLIDNNIDIYAGETPIVKVYAGESVVYDKQTAPYTPLTYLQSTGTQYIETNYTPNANTIIEFQVSDITTPSGTGNPNVVLYSASSQWDFTIYAMTYQEVNQYYGFRQMMYSNRNYTFGRGTYAAQNTFKLSDYGLTRWFNGTQIRTSGAITPSHLTTLHICGENRYNDNGLQSNYYKTYYFKIWEGDTLIYDFIPVLDSNNVACLYDKVSETYFYNAGSGTFLYG